MAGVAALASGLLLCLTHAWAPFLAIFAPVPLLRALRHVGSRRAFYLGLMCGICEGFVLCGLLYADWMLLLGLCLFFGLSRAAFAVAVVAMGGGRGPLGPPVQAALWVLMERLQAATPFSLPALLGDTQHVGPFLPLARLGGTYLISFQLVWLAASLAGATLGAASVRRLAARMSPPLTAWLLLGSLARGALIPQPRGTQTFNVVQGGLPTWFYSRAEQERAWAPLPEQVYTSLTETAPPAALTVWPETAVWAEWGRDTAFMQRLRRLRQNHGPLLVGVPRRDADQLLRNAAVLIDAHEQAVDKRRLGLRAEAAFTPGTGAPLLTWAPAPVGVVFCLESVVPEYARTLVAAGAGALVVMAEGSRFGGTPVGRLHAQRSVLRAVETGRTVVHAGQQGFSRIIGPDGQDSATLPTFYAGVVHGEVAFDAGITPFVRYGDATLWPQVLLVLAAALARGQHWRKARTQANKAR